MVPRVKMKTQISDRLSIGFTVSLDANQAGTGDDCYWMKNGFYNCLAGQAFLSDNSLILFSRIDLTFGFSGRNRASIWVQAAGPVPAFFCLAIYQEHLTL